MVNKKSIFITVSVLVILFLSYIVVRSVILKTIDEANERGIELYASSLKYKYTNYLYNNGFEVANLDDLTLDITTKVECEKKSITKEGVVTLEGCSVENSKQKYSYKNGKVEKE